MRSLAAMALFLSAVILFAPIVPPARPAAAQAFGPCSLFDYDYWQGNRLTPTDNGSTVTLRGVVVTDKRPTGSVRVAAKHVFAFRSDPTIASGTGSWTDPSSDPMTIDISPPWDQGPRYVLSWETTISKSGPSSFRGQNSADVRLVFTWQSGRSTYQEQTCSVEIEL